MGQIRAHVQASQEVLGKTEQDNWLMVLPLFHVNWSIYFDAVSLQWNGSYHIA